MENKEIPKITLDKELDLERENQHRKEAQPTGNGIQKSLLFSTIGLWLLALPQAANKIFILLCPKKRSLPIGNTPPVDQPPSKPPNQISNKHYTYNYYNEDKKLTATEKHQHTMRTRTKR